MSGNRAENRGYDEALARTEAQELYDVSILLRSFPFHATWFFVLQQAGKGKVGTDESVFVRIICSRSYQQLSATFAIYAQIANVDIEKSIKSEMSGDLERACLAIGKSPLYRKWLYSLFHNCFTYLFNSAKAVNNKPKYYAEQLHEAMAGAGTKDEDLIRLLVCVSEVRLSLSYIFFLFLIINSSHFLFL